MERRRDEHLALGQLPAVTDASVPLEVRLDKFRYALEQYPKEIFGPDERLHSFAEALVRKLDHPEVRREFGNVFHLRTITAQDISIPVMANLTFRAVQKQLLRQREELNYPEAFQDRATWEKALRPLLQHARLQPQSQSIYPDLLWRRVQSNLAVRYFTHKILAHLYRDLVGENPTMLDVGSAQNQGAKQLALNLPFQPVSVGTALDYSNGRSHPSVVHDHSLSETLNGLANTPIQWGEIYGADIFEAEDRENQEWAKSCSFTPSELLDRRKEAQYDKRNNARPENVKSVRWDFGARELPDIFIDRPPEKDKNKFGIGSLTTVIYQEGENRRRRKIVRLLSNYAKVLVVQDFVRPTGSRFGFSVADALHERPFGYRIYVRDIRHKEDGFQEFGRWNNGRCTELLLGKLALDRLAEFA